MMQRLAQLCERLAGLRIDRTGAYLIETRLGPLACREGFTSTEALLDALEPGGDARLSWAVVEAMAPPSNGFFTDPALFGWLLAEGLPGLAAESGPVRVWVADCGTGQEIYSLAMALAEKPSLAARIELYASDLSERNLEAAQAGVYSAYEVQRGLSAQRLVQHFEARGEAFALLPKLRASIRWRRVNLHDPSDPLGRFEAVICRRGLSRMTPEAAGAALARLAGAVTPGGLLVLGRDPPETPGLVAARPDLGVFRTAIAPALHAA